MVQIFAHRGFSGYYPENTMLAFQKVAEETVADGIELDIQLTKDGEIVIMQPFTLMSSTVTLFKPAILKTSSHNNISGKPDKISCCYKINNLTFII